MKAWKSALRGRRMMSALWDPLYGSVSGKSTNHYFSPRLSTWKWLHHMNGAVGQQPTTSSLNSGEERLCASPWATRCFTSMQSCQINDGHTQRLLCKTELLTDNKINVTNTFSSYLLLLLSLFFRAWHKKCLLVREEYITSAKLQICLLFGGFGFFFIFSGYQTI